MHKKIVIATKFIKKKIVYHLFVENELKLHSY
jgi:hypothetical protein